MNKLQSANMGWGERLAIIDNFDLSDDQAVSRMGITIEELETARGMANSGVFTTPKDINFGQYVTELAGTVRPTPKTEDVPTSTVMPTVLPAPPVTATKPIKQPKKRGRKGSKIVDAFAAIPVEPTNADEFAQQHNVSMAVLKQSKRFDKTGLGGNVRVKKDRQAGIMMVWREPAE